MFIRRNSDIVGFCLIGLVLTACLAKGVYTASVEDLDGTWLYGQRIENSTRIHDKVFSWGIGKRVVDGTLEIDTKKMTFLMPGDGLFRIQKIRKTNASTVQLDIKGPGDDGGWEMKLQLHYSSADSFILECLELQKSTTDGLKKPWYRLSGPPPKK